MFMSQFMTGILDRLSSLFFKYTVFLLAILLCAGMGIALSNMSRLSTHLIKSQAIENAAQYAYSMKEARTLYSDEVVDRIKNIRDISAAPNYSTQLGGIPLPATYLLELGHRISEGREGLSMRLYSDYPFPWRVKEGGPKDNFEREALSYLRKYPTATFTRFETFQGHPTLRYAEADILKPSCVGCHNSLKDSPKKDWQIGDVRGILEVNTTLDRYMMETNIGLQSTFIMLVILSGLALSGIALVMAKLHRTSKELEHRVLERTADLQEANQLLGLEREKSDRLLLNILPQVIADQLKQGHTTIADWFGEVTILFADIVGFTQLSTRISPTDLVNLLNEIFSAFDRLTEKYGLEKIKTIGDNYMVVGGLPKQRPDHAEAVARMAIEMQQEISKFNLEHNVQLNIRIGINTGSVVAGVIGTKKFTYDLWGDAVNTASRMESHGIPGTIQVSATTYEKLKNKFALESRGVIEIKGKGKMNTYLLAG
jgi:adenylate cyclase